MDIRGARRAEPATYTVDQVAALLGISRGMAYTFVNDGVIPAKRIGRRWVVARAAFHAWLSDSDNLPKAV
ncbi:helix-turn-helix domain-containing protein [Nocardia cyriacigeorgica]|uniref:Helix-turn-helix domain-containing protein n=1 Tax=Nocardia cyriacigeorgica TaxID=135487 RepID=A0A6P1DI38_9NOCA|nr:helix-turn-helix domain-containing protein [Nocardia cyriacigeorgica]NEW48280.1 helix-turn-helix domain-containing protein [Nocardia cyriacigeorgica]